MAGSRIYFAAISTVIISLIACVPEKSGSMLRSTQPRDPNPEIEQTIFHGFVDSNNDFAFDLFRMLQAGKDNIVFSPYSISEVVAMVYAGAHDDTETQMAQAMHFDLSQDLLHKAFNQLDISLSGLDLSPAAHQQSIQLTIANSVWLEKTLVLLSEYLDVIARNYNAGIHQMDFINQSEHARRQINSWVSEQTRERIKDLIPSGLLDNTTRMVLVNAINFRGDWQNPFNPNNNRVLPFSTVDGSQVQADIMLANLDDALYADGDDFAAIEIPYQGGNSVMDLILPEASNFENMARELDNQKLKEICAAMQPTRLSLGLPKFTFNSSFDLASQLSALGMKNAFIPEHADFSGMTGGRDLFIALLMHRSFIAVGEKGTEAAAATSVVMAPTSVFLPQENMILDHPFIFVIRDRNTDQILFLGWVLDPTQ